MALFPWVQSFTKSFKDPFDEGSYSNIEKWLKVIGDRPQVQKGLKVCARDP
jgi:hypothetical protein